jgi:hypothetical protein
MTLILADDEQVGCWWKDNLWQEQQNWQTPFSGIAWRSWEADSPRFAGSCVPHHPALQRIQVGRGRCCRHGVVIQMTQGRPVDADPCWLGQVSVRRSSPYLHSVQLCSQQLYLRTPSPSGATVAAAQLPSPSQASHHRLRSHSPSRLCKRQPPLHILTYALRSTRASRV